MTNIFLNLNKRRFWFEVCIKEVNLMATCKQELIKEEVHSPQLERGSCKILDGYNIT